MNGPEDSGLLLANQRARAGAPLEWGARWRYHLREHAAGMLAAVALLTAYLAAGVLVTGARHAGQSSDLRTLLLPHAFEHGLGYLLVPLAAGAFYLAGGGRGSRARA